MATNTIASSKPAISYLDDLKKIAAGEANSARMLTVWADVTPDAELAKTLRLVAAREANHSRVFSDLVVELGDEVCCEPDRAAYARLAIVSNPALSDADKIIPIGDADPFVERKRLIAEGAYDPITANHMNWWIIEEYDSLARLRAAHEAVLAKAANADCGAECSGAEPSADAQAIMACMTEGFAKLEKSIGKLNKTAK